MRFVDECNLSVEAGDGGNGAVAFRREKFVPFGGPAGGDGGRGGDVVFLADSGLSTLYDLAHLRKIRAQSGQHGGGKDCYGKSGKDTEVRVPQGTIIFDAESGELLTELTAINDRFVIAEGGRGGRGNKHFATPVDRAPRRAEPGGAGQKRELRLELKVMADVGLLGFPNVGKSTLISSVSRAHPKVADYPFTTLIPHLGVVRVGDVRRGLGRSFVIADIPGLIPGASEGAGLGTRFLRHVERTRVLLHLVSLSEDPERDPLSDYDAIRTELGNFNPEMLRRPEIVALTKADLTETREEYPTWKARFEERGLALRLVSAASHHGLDDLMQELVEALLI
ncbi:MAG TPA: GTPase ObgE [Polyangiaceae bacterium]|nr:GTPase ObgE [Polyangiaceae bacterium]